MLLSVFTDRFEKVTADEAEYSDEAEQSDAAVGGLLSPMLLPHTDAVLTFSNFLSLSLFLMSLDDASEMVLLDEAETLANEIESLLDDRFEEELRRDALLRLLEELRVLTELLELLQLTELREE